MLLLPLETFQQKYKEVNNKSKRCNNQMIRHMYYLIDSNMINLHNQIEMNLYKV